MALDDPLASIKALILLRLDWIEPALGANLHPTKRRTRRSRQDDPPEPDHHPAPRLRAEKVRRNKEAALNAFIGKKAEIDAMLARMQALSDDHFNCHPDEVGWAMVGTLEYYAGLLKRVTDSAFGEGEHAD